MIEGRGGLGRISSAFGRGTACGGADSRDRMAQKAGLAAQEKRLAGLANGLRLTLGKIVEKFV